MRRMKQKSNIFVHFCCNYWISKFTPPPRPAKKKNFFENINKPDFSNIFTSVEWNLYHKQFTSYPHARTLPLRQRVQVPLQMHTEFWWENLREQDQLEDPGVDGMAILKRIFNKWNREAWTGLIWLRRGTSGGLL
jgi:hypothetical protein